MSTDSNVPLTPKAAASLITSTVSAECSRALVGMQPRCRQVPPTLSRSIITTLMPSSDARSAAAYPPLPPPRTTRSTGPLGEGLAAGWVTAAPRRCVSIAPEPTVSFALGHPFTQEVQVATAPTAFPAGRRAGDRGHQWDCETG